MYTLTTTDTLTFVLEGFEQALAFRAKVKVAKEDIQSIIWYEKFDQWPDMLIRMPGSFLPAWIMAGSYWNEEGWDFVFAKKPKGLLLPLLFDVLVLETSQQKYKRIIVNIPKKKSQEIIAWWKEK